MGQDCTPLTTSPYIAPNSVGTTQLEDIATARIIGRLTAGTGDPEYLTGTQVTTILDLVNTTLKGLMSVTDKIKLDGAYKDAVTDGGCDKTGAIDCTAQIAAMISTMPATGGRIYFPVGTYKITGNINVDKPIIFFGASRNLSVINTTAGTGNMFTCITGAQGAGWEQIRFSAATAGTRTAGYCVDFGAIANVYIQQVDILYQWSGVHSGGALQFVDDVNIREGGQNAASGAAVLIDSTGDRYIRRLTTDQTNVSTYAGIRIRECSSCVITDSNIIHSGNALDIVPNAGGGHQAASILSVNTFYDSSTNGLNVVPATNNDSVNRVRFINCWFSTMSANGVTLGSAAINVANVNSVDFVGCDFYQNVVGIDVLGVAEWSVRSSRIAGNSTAGIRTAQGLQASVHAFTISDNVIGNVAGFGANGVGVTIQSGTYKRYQIFDNRGLDTNTTKGITDAGVVAATDQKLVTNNMGHNAVSSTIGADVTFTVTELILCQLRVPAGTRFIGETFNIRMAGTGPLAAGNFTFKVRVGPLGTATGDPAAYTSSAGVGVITGRHGVDLQAVMKTATSVRVEGQCFSNAAVFSPTAGAPPAATTVTTTADWFITLTGIMSASTSVATTGSIQPV